MLEIARMLTISTAHISKETADLLAGDVDFGIDVCWGACLSVYNKGDYGWLVFADAANTGHPGMPADLAACLRLAQENDCEWLCLDRDGDVVESLPVYDW